MFFEKHDTEGSQENIQLNFREGGDYNTSMIIIHQIPTQEC